MTETTKDAAARVAAGSWTEVLAVFLRLGLTSFGGPIAHLGYFREEFVGKRRWLDDRAYADLVALCQFLPGPASSQVGIAIGLSRAGYAGALAAWTGRALRVALNPNSSRACAPSASFAMNSFATCAASSCPSPRPT